MNNACAAEDPALNAEYKWQQLIRIKVLFFYFTHRNILIYSFNMLLHLF